MKKERRLRKNAMLLVDSYKLGHITMYPKGTEVIYGNLTPRSTRHLDKVLVPKYNDGTIVMYGSRLAIEELKETFDMWFFELPLEEVLADVEKAVKPFIGDNSPEGILTAVENLHKLQYLPVLIKWLPEGTLSPAGIPMMTIKSTHPDFGWLPQYLEDILSSETWKKPTAATIARHYRLICEDFAEQTCDNNFHVPYQGHDFSPRGMSGIDDFFKTGTGHLTQFQGSDNVSAAYLIENIYVSQALVACSVPATEHSVMQLASSSETEVETFRRLIKQYNKGIVSIVSDTWDFWDTITVKALELKDEILAREEDSLGLSKVVFRPDSGDPVDVICGVDLDEATAISSTNIKILNDGRIYTEYTVASSLAIDENGIVYKVEDANFAHSIHYRGYYLNKIPEAEVKGAIECLWGIFGGTVNSKEFKVLNPKVGLIYGDSITPQRAVDIFTRLKAKGFASSNVVLGIGSFTYQHITRDSLGFAMKATYAEINGEAFNIFKSPKTDSGKKSAKGLLRVDNIDGKLVLKQECTKEEELGGLLEIGFCNGGFIEDAPSWDDIRARAQA